MAPPISLSLVSVYLYLLDQDCRNGGGRWGIGLPTFWQITPIQTRGIDYAHHISTCPYQIFRPSASSLDLLEIEFVNVDVAT